MEVIARSKNIRISARKIRLLVEAVKNLPPLTALTQLKFLNKRAAIPLRKTIENAVNNASFNFKLTPDDLRIKEILVQDGPSFKRWQPAARGGAHPYKKRTSHLKVVLTAENKNEKKDKRRIKKTDGTKS